MALRLAISSRPADARPEVGVRELVAGDLTIGRQADNGWALPSRHVSRHHCVIRGIDGQYWLTDLSSNGVFLDDEDQPVGRDNTVMLRQGQRLRIGDYELVVEIAGAGPRAAPDFTAIEDAQLRAEGPMLPVRDFRGAPLPGEERTYWGAGPERPNEGFRRFDPFALPADPQSRSADLEREHPIGDHFEAPRPLPPQHPPVPPVEAPPAAGPAKLPANLADLLATGLPPAAPAPALPGPAPAVAPVLPPVLPPYGEADQPLPPATAPAAAPLPPQPPPAEAAPLPPPAPAEAEARFEATPAQAARLPIGPAAAPAPAPAAPVPAPPVAASETSAAEAALVARFLAAAGVRPDLLAGQDPAATMDALGGAFRSVVEGTIRLLEARAEMKSEFAVELTLLTVDDNNPLKFSADPGQAIERLLGPDRRGFLPPQAAFEEAFRDVADHQLALLAGFRDAWTDLLGRVDPDALEQRIGKEKGLSGLIASHKARCWDVFCERYREIRDEADQVFRFKVADALRSRLNRRQRSHR